MAQCSGRLVGYQDLTVNEIRSLIIGAFSEEYTIAFAPGGRVCITLEKPKKEYRLSSFIHLMRHAPVRIPLRKICKIYRKVKNSNCIVRIYLRTTEVVLNGILETCESCLGLNIDEFTLLGMMHVEQLMTRPKEQIIPITRLYNVMIQGVFNCNWLYAEDYLLQTMRLAIRSCMNVFSVSWVPESFIQIPPMDVIQRLLDDPTC